MRQPDFQYENSQLKEKRKKKKHTKTNSLRYTAFVPGLCTCPVHPSNTQ